MLPPEQPARQPEWQWAAPLPHPSVSTRDRIIIEMTAAGAKRVIDWRIVRLLGMKGMRDCGSTVRTTAVGVRLSGTAGANGYGGRQVSLAGRFKMP